MVTSNKPFSAWGTIFGDDVVAAAMIDQLVHHTEILALNSDSYLPKNHDLAAPSAAKPAPADCPPATRLPRPLAASRQRFPEDP
jgi:IstB-like ATP binding protein